MLKIELSGKINKLGGFFLLSFETNSHDFVDTYVNDDRPAGAGPVDRAVGRGPHP